jgi:hypothetical protein
VNAVASPRAVALIRERGGRLYVWLDRQRCCQGATYLHTAFGRPPGHLFDAIGTDQRFELHLDTGSRQPPSEIHLDVRGLRRERVEAYWNGCVFVA